MAMRHAILAIRQYRIDHYLIYLTLLRKAKQNKTKSNFILRDQLNKNKSMAKIRRQHDPKIIALNRNQRDLEMSVLVWHNSRKSRIQLETKQAVK